MSTTLSPELSLAVDDVVFASMRRHTPGLVTVLRTLVALGETDERIMQRCREVGLTLQTYRNVGHALAVLRRENVFRPLPLRPAAPAPNYRS